MKYYVGLLHQRLRESDCVLTNNQHTHLKCSSKGILRRYSKMTRHFEQSVRKRKYIFNSTKWLLETSTDKVNI